jgi:uncharacterized protein YqhQ
MWHMMYILISIKVYLTIRLKNLRSKIVDNIALSSIVWNIPNPQVPAFPAHGLRLED